MQTVYQFPLKLTFRIGTLANDFIAQNAQGDTIAYVREKILKLVDKIDIYSDETKSRRIYKIEADRWLDFNSNYAFYGEQDNFLGSVARKGWASLWSAHYEIFNKSRQLMFIVNEENPFIKILDGILGEIPFVNFLVGYFFNPKYIVKKQDGTLVARLIKLPSFWGRKFTIEAYELLSNEEEELIFLGLTEVSLLERRRG